MSKNMLIDSAHPEEIRVAVVDGEKLDRYDFETPSKTQLKGNIYLGKVVQVEPSLQAAFVDCGNGKHGFLSFSEIHHDYFQIPVGDREELEERIQNAINARPETNEYADEETEFREISQLRYQFYRRYKIQEVIKKRQIMLVQVTKEERGNKGASLSTYISLAGRYCVLMPNMPKGGGVSKKITDPKDREKLKKIVSELPMKNGSAVIRTAGIGHSKTEIKKDFDYLGSLWDEIRETTLQSTAPCSIHEEANIIKRAIRDLYTRDVESIIVEGEEGYKIAKGFVRKLMPSHSKKVRLYDDKKIPLFSKYKINEQVNQIYSTRVDLPSGGYLVINTTEALVSIDVNSGRSTRERNVGGTALKTNLEAAVEIARQCCLRDLAGLLVVDFIDMDDKKNNSQVERCLREAFREDKAKTQVGSISNFGLLEFSRQRLGHSIADANMVMCNHCSGTGTVWSQESIALQILRKIEETCMALDLREVKVTLSTDLVVYLLNNKRSFIESIESRGLKISFLIDTTISASDFKISHISKMNEEDIEQSLGISDRPYVRKRRRDRQRYNNKQIATNESDAAMPIAQMSDNATDTHHSAEKNNNTVEFCAYTARNRNKDRLNRREFSTPAKVDKNEKPSATAKIDVVTNPNSTLDNDARFNLPNETKSVFDNPAKKPVHRTYPKKPETPTVNESDPAVVEKNGRNKRYRHPRKNKYSAAAFVAEDSITSDRQTSTVAITEKKIEASEARSPQLMSTSTGVKPQQSNDASNTARTTIDIPQHIINFGEHKELSKLASNHRLIEEDLTNLAVMSEGDMMGDSIAKKNKKSGWWQKLIKKPDEK